jgi:hypothetical protein
VKPAVRFRPGIPGLSTQRGLFVLDKISDGAALAALLIVAVIVMVIGATLWLFFSWIGFWAPVLIAVAAYVLIKFSSRIPRRIRDRCL